MRGFPRDSGFRYTLSALCCKETPGLTHICFAPGFSGDVFKSTPDNGAGGGTRTLDLMITNHLLYQLSYTSK